MSKKMLSLQSLCASVVLHGSLLVVENESLVCAIVADALSLPSPVDIDPRNKNTLRNLRACAEMFSEMTTVHRIQCCATYDRLDLVDRLLDSITSQQKKIKIAIDLHEADEDELAQYVEQYAKVNYNFIYTNPQLLHRITRREVFVKIVSAGLNLERDFKRLLCFDYAFCRSYYYPYNQWILESLPVEVLRGHDLMICYDNYRMAIVQDATIEVVSELVY